MTEFKDMPFNMLCETAMAIEMERDRLKGEVASLRFAMDPNECLNGDSALEGKDDV